MQRPVMNPTFTFEQPPPAKKKPKTPRARFAWVWRAIKLLGRLLLFSPFGHKAHFRNEDGSRANFLKEQIL